MLTKETILQATNGGLAVFRHYIPGQWQPGKNFRNPFYNDTRASCSVYLDKKRRIYRLNDFGDPRYSGDCFALVGLLKGLDCRHQQEFPELLRIINREMQLGLSEGDNGYPNAKILRKPKAVALPNVQAASRPAKTDTETDTEATYSVKQVFSAAEDEYWLAYGITAGVRERFGVVALHFFVIRKEGRPPWTVQGTAQEPVFGYVHPQCVKVYRPFSRHRFLYLGKKPDEYVFGLEQLPPRGDVLFVTGGEKDVMSLAAHGFSAICFNSETAAVPPPVVKKLSYRFKHIILLYDTDQAGVEASSRHVEVLGDFEVKQLLLPLPGTKEAKDISDFFRLGGTAQQIRKLISSLLVKLYSETFAMLKPCEIDFNNPPPIPEPLVSINGVTIGSAGNLLGITGGEGTGKSNFLGGLVAGTLKQEHQPVDSLGTEVKPNTGQKALLYYDTEQSEDQLFRNLQSVLTRAGRQHPPRWFRAYCLTHLSRQERLRVIVQSMDRFHHQYGGIHLVVIDGIGDLIRSLNDEGESVALIEELHRLAGIYQTCILCVLHLVPSGIKLRGHLGSELQRKAAGILCIEKDTDTDVSTVKALKVRSGSPLDVPLLEFAWDKQKGYHVFVGEKSKEAKQSRKQEDLQLLANELFADAESLSYTELMNAIAGAMEVTTRTAKNYIRFMLSQKIVTKHPVTERFVLV